VTSGLSFPLYVTSAHDGSNRLFILEQPGRIKVLQPGQSTPTVFLDITSKVKTGGELGLLGLAFHPQYSSNRRFFVNYTRRPDSTTVIAEYRVSESDPNAAETEETVILTIDQPFDNHNGGMIEFGPDGFLYIGMGDGGNGGDPGNRAQNLEELLGKMLRIDIDNPESSTKLYSSPSTNPFFGSTPGRDEIYAVGLRNPWRYSFDRGTGQLYAGDVGQNEVEEVDVITLGSNLGWKKYEGSRCFSGPCSSGTFVFPIVEYTNTGGSGRCSVTGGYVYRGTRSTLPTGAYVYADYCSGEIFMLEGGAQSVLLDTARRVSSFGEDEAGEIYVVDHTGGIYRMTNPEAPSGTSLYFPRLVSTDGSGSDSSEYTGIAVANLGGSSAALAFTAFDRSGAPLSGSNISNPKLMELKAGEQIPIVDAQVFGSGLPGNNPVGWFKLDSSSSRVAGFFLMFNSSLSVLDGADVSSKSLTSFILPEIEDQGFTQIHVANLNSSSANVTFDLMTSSGVLRSRFVRTINRSGAVAESFTDLFPGITPVATDYILVSADRGVVPFEYLGKTGQYVEGLNGQDATAGATTLYSPQYATGPGWRSTLSIVNLESSAGTVTFQFIKDDGTSIGAPQAVAIAAKGKIHVTDQAFFVNAGSSLMQGYIKVTSNGPRLAGSVVFGDPGRSAFASALPLVSSLQTIVVFSQVASNDTYFTGVAMINPNDADATLTLEVYKKTGELLISKQEVVGAKKRKSLLLTEYFPSLVGQQISSGYIKLTSDRSLASFALFGTTSLSVLSAVLPQVIP
jgi:hypothetical protein